MVYEGGSWRVRRRRPLRGVLLVVAVVLFVCGVGVAGLAVWNVQAMRGHAGQARRAVEVFLGEVAAGDAAGAYGRLCAVTRGRWGRDEFVVRLAVPPTIVGFRIVGVRVEQRAGQPRGTVTVRLTRQSGLVGEHRLPVVREDGVWRVCGDPL